MSWPSPWNLAIGTGLRQMPTYVDVSLVAPGLTVSDNAALSSIGVGFSRVRVPSYWGDGKGVASEYYPDPSDTTSDDDGGTVRIGLNELRWKLIHDGTVDATQFGVRADGTTIDDDAMSAAYAWVSTQSQTVPGVSDKRGTAVLTLPAGTIKITTPEALMGVATPATKVYGFSVVGAGSSLTRIIFSPGAGAAAYLCHNNRWLRPSFTGIEFICDDATSSFMWAEELGGVTNIQDARFDDCTWSGTWTDLIKLNGGNNNSEWKFHQCNVLGSISGYWINVPAATASDQFLNFWFHQCRFWSATGGILNLNFGGSVKIDQFDVSGWQPSVDTYLFNLLGSAHAQGVCTFLANGLRVEHKSDHALLMHSQWPQGSITFNQLDQSSQIALRSASVVYCSFEAINVMGAIITFRDSQLLGKHLFTGSSNNYRTRQIVSYENCTVMQQTNFEDFATNTGYTNKGGKPNIRTNRCRTTNDYSISAYHNTLDTDLNWNAACAGHTTRKLIQLVGANSDAPINGTYILFALPRNVVITGVMFFKTAGGNGAQYTYDLLMGDGSATPANYTNLVDLTTPTPVQVRFSGTNAAAQSYQEFKCFYPTFDAVLPDSKRFIKLLENEINNVGAGHNTGANRTLSFTGYYMLVEYIG